jgi:membrane associated rhomboid family serine protease
LPKQAGRPISAQHPEARFEEIEARACLVAFPRQTGGADWPAMHSTDRPAGPAREPYFNVPGVIVATLALLLSVHLVRELILPTLQDVRFLRLFAFIPARYDTSLVPGGAYPGGAYAEIWTFFTYSLIHGDFVHLGANTIWLLPFGTAIARRFGPLRYLAFFAVTAACAAAVHLATHAGEDIPMVGASGAISAMMAASMRFVFQPGAPLGLFRTEDDQSYRARALPLGAAFRDLRVVVFIAVWFGLNTLIGLGSISIAGEQSVAWQAHIGGFLGGLLLFAVFDPVSRHARDRSRADAGPTLH